MKKDYYMCDCPELKKLYKLKRLVKIREEKYEGLQKDFIENEVSITALNRYMHRFENAINFYEEELTNLVHKKNLVLEKSGLETKINCANCSKKIDLQEV